MDSAVTTDLNSRIQKLESRFRFVVSMWMLSAFFLAFLGPLMQPAISQDVVGLLRVRRVEIVDSSSKARIVLTAVLQPPELVFIDENGSQRFRLSASRTGGHLSLGGFQEARFEAVVSDPATGILLTGGLGYRDSITVGTIPGQGPRMTMMDSGRLVFRAP